MAKACGLANRCTFIIDVQKIARVRPLTFTAVIVLCVVLQGCNLGEWASNGLKVGPNYKTPPAPVAGEWIDYNTPTTVPSE